MDRSRSALRLPWTGDEAEDRRRRDPILASAGWIYRLREAPVQPALIFPAGFTYASALRVLFIAATIRGRLPRSTRLAGPMPAGIVVGFPGDAGGGLAIDLRAPWGWDGRGVAAPGMRAPGVGRWTNYYPWPSGALLDVPALPPEAIAVRCGADWHRADPRTVLLFRMTGPAG